MLSFGMPTLIETASVREYAALCQLFGLQFIEINMNLPQHQPCRLNTEELLSISRAFHIDFTFHLDENLDISDFNPYVAAAYLRTVRETIFLAQQIHAPVINMHLSRGVYFTMPDRRAYLYDEYRKEYLDSILAFRQECEKCIGDSGIVIAIENTDGYTRFQREALNLLLASSAFALTLDVGHNHVTGGTDEIEILSRPGALRHMHLHDASGKACHLPLGAGCLNIAKYLSLARANACRVVLETKTIPSLIHSVKWLRANNFI